MAIKAVGTDISIVASGDLSANQFRAVKLDANGRTVLSGLGDLQTVGVQQDKPTALGQPSMVRISGVTKALAGGTVAIGARVTSDATGRLITATTGNQVLGIALTAAVVGDIFTVLLDSRGVV
jgi:hypothetical protein